MTIEDLSIMGIYVLSLDNNSNLTLNEQIVTGRMTGKPFPIEKRKLPDEDDPVGFPDEDLVETINRHYVLPKETNAILRGDTSINYPTQRVIAIVPYKIDPLEQEGVQKCIIS
ncbi:hypothetical protein CL617_01455 [archaeon]|nr:hypothetical protein [archaeon]|tara:strand:+ start:10184 stop:10522 length:339 start_codon:yes stop_codon:yes gene_type:complete